MYNTEKYIGACLESILGQTFQDYEVIVVDDCSTDKSTEIVESYIPKFGGRLKLSRMKENSGTPAEPCNRGLKFSRGKYIYFMDNDDLLLSTALETFYKFAETSNADVIRTGSFFVFDSNSEEIFPSKVGTIHGGKKIFDKPAFDTENIFERVNNLCSNGYARPAWTSFVLRDLLIENEIVMEDLPWAVDTVWTFKVMFCAKKILHIPEPLYFWRRSENSISHHKRNLQENMNFHMCTAVGGVKQLCNFMDKQNFFKENPKYYLLVIDYFWNNHASFFLDDPANLIPNEFYERVRIAISEKVPESDDAKIMAYLCTLYNFKNLLAQQKINELENKLKQLQGG